MMKFEVDGKRFRKLEMARIHAMKNLFYIDRYFLNPVKGGYMLTVFDHYGNVTLQKTIKVIV